MANIVRANHFEKRKIIPEPDLSSKSVFPPKNKVKAIFDASMKWHLIETYGIDSFTELADGTLLFEHEYSDEDGLVAWILSLRTQATVIEPEAIRRKLYSIAAEVAEKYRGGMKHEKSINCD